MKSLKSAPALLAVLIALLLALDIFSRVFSKDVAVHAAAPAQYKIVAAPGRDADLQKFETTLNDMAKQGWEFDNWLYRGSVQTPDLIFKKR